MDSLPMKYSKEIVKRILDNIKIGLNQDDSAAEAGLSETQFYEWKKSKPEFAKALKDAHLSRKKRNLAIISKAAITKWQAAAWDLERRYREEFASWFHHEHSGPKGGPIPIVGADLSKMTFKEIEALGDKLDAFLRPPESQNDDK